MIKGKPGPGVRRFSEEQTRTGMRVVLVESRGGRNGSISSQSSLSPTSPSTPPAAKGTKSPAADSNGAAEAWSTSRHFSADEKRAQEIADAVKQKKASFAMLAPKLTGIESRQMLVAWEASKVEEEVDYHVEMSVESSPDFKKIYSGAALEHLVTGLSPGVLHSFRVYAATATLNGDCSPVETAKTLAAAPETPHAPRLLNRTRATITLKWSVVSENGAGISAYILEWDQGLGNGKFVELYTGLERQFKVTEKLQPGQGYSFRLCAENSVGKSAFSQVTKQFTQVGVPRVPAAPSLARRSSSSITVAWETPAGNGGSVTDCKLEMDDPDTDYGFRAAYSGDAECYTCDNLKPATMYKFRVSASNSQGSSKPSEVSSFLTLAAPPGCPQNVRLLGALQPFSFSAQWGPPTVTGGGEVIGYIAEIANTPDTTYRSVFDDVDRQCQVTSLEPGKKYMLRVAARSEEGGPGEWAQPLSVKLPACVPGSPSSPYVSGRPKASSVMVAWGPPEFIGGAEITSYTLELATEGSDEYRAVYDGPRTSHNVQPLQPGVTYKFRVKAGNSAGKGMYSSACTAITGAAPPGLPENVSTTATSSSALQLTWEAAATHGTPVREYVAEHQQGDSYVQVYRGKELSCTVRSLKPASTHSFRVAAVSDSGQGSWSLVACGTTQDGPPAAVSGLSLVSSTSDQLTVSWPTPPCHGQAISHYYLELVGANSKTITETSTRATFTDLRASTAYKIRVQAVNRIGSGPFSPVVTGSTRAARPSPPTLELAASYHNALKLRWSARQGCDYRLQLAEGNQSSFETVYDGSALSYKATNLEPCSLYRLRVCAENEAGVSEYSDVQSFQTTEPPPPPPRDVKVESITGESALLSWQAIVTDGRVHKGYTASCQFEVQCMEEGGDYRTVFTGDSSCQSYKFSSLRPGTKYSLRVRVKTSSSVSESTSLYSSFSRVVSFTTIASATADTVIDGKVDKRKSPKAQTSPSAGAAATSSSKGKPYQRTKKPPKKVGASTSQKDVASTDQRQAIFIIVLFGLVAVLVAIAASLYFVA
ncbi:fibronectin type-III domain-containing protein 3A-like isoform X1 [Sycon ciliatum]|uniref:fibronectin type-III domain-containing protein 3A-like isoform X1 n=1 Tax=Sycon ciliatum TaxID=27933 RepID=UPI0031F67B15